MKTDFFWVDAFTRRLFGGNPAAVIPLDDWMSDERMQQIATENNLPMTAYLVRTAAQRWHIRWFSPTTEVSLCGHATLAAGYILLEVLGHDHQRIEFDSRGGPLAVTRGAEGFQLDFPANVAVAEANPPRPLSNAVQATPREWLRWENYHLAVVESAEEVLRANPDFAAWSSVGDERLIVTAPGRDCDFVSRFFAPGIGILEDSVTGSSHCLLTPYWAQRLGRPKLHARQLSRRGGELFCELKGERVMLGGHSVLYLRGQIDI